MSSPLRRVRVRLLSISCLVAGVFSTPGFAQGATGTVSGTVVNSASGLGVPNATVSVVGSAQVASTALDGSFILTEVPVGAQVLQAERDGFKPSTVTGLQIEAGGRVRADVPLHPQTEKIIEMERFTVAADVVESSDIGLLAARQRATALSDAIGSEQFGRLAVGNAAEAMTKVTGASLVDGKYVLIRGLGDRYANTLMNGVAIPSADPDKRAVQMDQFPTGLVESIVTTKSFTPDQPGAFSGGSVNLKTRSFPEQFFASFAASIKANTQATGETALRVTNDGRGAPELAATLPSRTLAEITARQGNFTAAEELDRATRAFASETIYPRGEKGKADLGFSAAVGNRHAWGDEGLFGYTASVTVDRSLSQSDGGEANRFLGTASAPQPRILLTGDTRLLSFDSRTLASGIPPLGVTSSTFSESVGVFAKLAVRPALDHEISLDVFRSESTDDTVRRGVGEEANNYTGSVFEVYDLLYTERVVESLQLAGKSLFPGLRELQVDWRASLSSSTQDQPDYRTLAAVYQPDGTFVNATGVQPNRFFRELKEDATEVGADFTLPFVVGQRVHRAKAGVVHGENERTYTERRFQYSLNPRSRDQLVSFPNPVGIVSRTATSVALGNTITRLQEPNNYTGDQTISAAYALADFQATDRVRVVGGVRFEKTEIQTTPTKVPGLAPKQGLISQTDALPALSVVFAASNRVNWRLAYGRTLARPTYKELTDIRYEDVFTGDVYLGNAGLKLTQIDNFDVRWEWFPRKGETVAVSGFYKRLDQPIEVLYQASVGSIQPQNVDRGTVYGVEFEFRRDLSCLGSRFSAFSVGANLSLVHSEVTIPEDEMRVLRSFDPGASGRRELLGQSPYVLNTDITYERPAWGTIATASFNVVGERLDLVNFGPLPDVFEQPAPSLNLVVSQRISSQWRLKLSAKNLLDPDREKTIGLNDRSLVYSRYREGRTFSLSASYLFE
ncbi:MAG: TonB-dependent receptor [Opitutaceae bacterium]